MDYLADGSLLERVYLQGTTIIEKWEYDGAMVFKDGQPYTMPIPEGRAVYDATSSTWINEFFITDHLGNVRVTFADEADHLKIRDLADYDPTGVEYQNSNVSVGGFKLDLFKFQDKESLSQTFGLNGLHDFGPRMLDKTIGGVWSQPDILGEMNETNSPFSYLSGQFLNMIDPTGMGEETLNLSSGLSSESISRFAFSSYSFGENDPKTKRVEITQNPMAMADLPTLKAYNPDIADRWREGNLGQQFAYGLVDGINSLFSNSHLGGAQFRNYDDKINTRMFGLISMTGPLFKTGSTGIQVIKQSEKAIVIGEGMNVIKSTANNLISQGINAKWYQAWSKNFPIGRQMTKTELNSALARNEAWINSKIKAGYKIYDIGIDPKRLNRSPFYELEKRIIEHKKYFLEQIPR
jgi:hypothetical protein